MHPAQQKYNHSLSLCLARHMARVYGSNEARAITRAARVIRSETTDDAMYQLAGMLGADLPPTTVNGQRMTADEQKIYCVSNLEGDLRKEGLL
jgi:hypothetical protein